MAKQIHKEGDEGGSLLVEQMIRVLGGYSLVETCLATCRGKEISSLGIVIKIMLIPNFLDEYLEYGVW